LFPLQKVNWEHWEHSFPLPFAVVRCFLPARFLGCFVRFFVQGACRLVGRDKSYKKTAFRGRFFWFIFWAENAGLAAFKSPRLAGGHLPPAQGRTDRAAAHQLGQVVGWCASGRSPHGDQGSAHWTEPGKAKACRTDRAAAHLLGRSTARAGSRSPARAGHKSVPGADFFSLYAGFQAQGLPDSSGSRSPARLAGGHLPPAQGRTDRAAAHLLGRSTAPGRAVGTRSARIILVRPGAGRQLGHRPGAHRAGQGPYPVRRLLCVGLCQAVSTHQPQGLPGCGVTSSGQVARAWGSP